MAERYPVSQSSLDVFEKSRVSRRWGPPDATAGNPFLDSAIDAVRVWTSERPADGPYTDQSAMTDDHPLVRLETLALIGIGGFAGSNLRFFALGLLSDVAAVLLVNVLGSFVLGFIVYEAEYTGVVDRSSRIVFTTGVLSSLTTYSTFAIQTALAAEPLLLVTIVAANYGLGFAGVLASRELARKISDWRPTASGGETA